MKVFKLMLIAAAIAVSVPAVAQDLSFGVKAGLNFSNFKVDADGYSVSPKSIAGINLGVYAVDCIVITTLSVLSLVIDNTSAVCNLNFTG